MQKYSDKAVTHSRINRKARTVLKWSCFYKSFSERRESVTVVGVSVCILNSGRSNQWKVPAVLTECLNHLAVFQLPGFSLGKMLNIKVLLWCVENGKCSRISSQNEKVVHYSGSHAVHFPLASTIQIDREPDIFKKKYVVLFFFKHNCIVFSGSKVYTKGQYTTWTWIVFLNGKLIDHIIHCVLNTVTNVIQLEWSASGFNFSFISSLQH